MSVETLVDFLRRRRDPDASSDLRDEWTAAIDALLGQMCDWLKPALDEGLLDVEISKVTIGEPALGTYDASVLRIRTSWQDVFVQPVSRVVLGGSGRLDVGSGPRRMVVTRCPDKSRWVVSSTNPSDDGQPLTEESFTTTLRHLLELSGI